MRLARSMSRLQTESAFEVLAKARALEAKGQRVIHRRCLLDVRTFRRSICLIGAETRSRAIPRERSVTRSRVRLRRAYRLRGWRSQDRGGSSPRSAPHCQSLLDQSFTRLADGCAVPVLHFIMRKSDSASSSFVALGTARCASEILHQDTLNEREPGITLRKCCRHEYRISTCMDR
jgi:hypothetical protein